MTIFLPVIKRRKVCRLESSNMEVLSFQNNGSVTTIKTMLQHKRNNDLYLAIKSKIKQNKKNLDLLEECIKKISHVETLCLFLEILNLYQGQQ